MVRPQTFDEPAKQIGIRLPSGSIQKLDELARFLNKTRSEVVFLLISASKLGDHVVIAERPKPPEKTAIQRLIEQEPYRQGFRQYDLPGPLFKPKERKR